mgnify:CR=1 FL=1
MAEMAADVRPGTLERELKDLHALLLATREALVDVASGEGRVHAEERHLLLHQLAELRERDAGVLGHPTRLAGSGLLRVMNGVVDVAQEAGDRHAGDGARVLEGQEEAKSGALVG